jgi:recombination protein U
MNSGKIFEAEFKASIPKDFYFLRLKDPAVGFSGGNSKFAPKNPYDFILHHDYLFCLELKSRDGALTFWQERFEQDGKKRTYEIHKHQIEGLTEAAKHDGVFAGLLLNYRNKETTVYVPIQRFNEFASVTEKKSINCDDALQIGILVDYKKLKVHYRYDIRKMCEEAVALGK